MKNLKNKRTAILAIILVGLLIVGYKMMFMVPDDSGSMVDENTLASQRVEVLLREVERINFNTAIVSDAKFKSLKSIEVPLLTLPVGRKNPFSAVSN